MHLSGGRGSLFQGLKGSLLAFVAGVSQMEKFILSQVWAGHRFVPPQVSVAKQELYSARSPGMKRQEVGMVVGSGGGGWGGVEKQMYAVCWSKQCSCFLFAVITM